MIDSFSIFELIKGYLNICQKLKFLLHRFIFMCI